MAGEGEASVSFQGKELFTVRVEGAGRDPTAPPSLLLLMIRAVVPYLVVWYPAGKISDSIVKLRAEVMTKLNAYMASESLTINGEGKIQLLFFLRAGIC